MRFLESKLTLVPRVKVKAMLLATSLCWLCIWRNCLSASLLGHKTFRECIPVLQHTVAYVVCIISKSETCKEKTQRDKTGHFPLCIIRLGELVS